ncbi:MAG: hypothetical protein OIN90_17310 [Candidatus Methanoperedens sp.]|nr:hypothetical protein [Candidatus Methanoperedens sp.]
MKPAKLFGVESHGIWCLVRMLRERCFYSKLADEKMELMKY